MLQRFIHEAIDKECVSHKSSFSITSILGALSHQATSPLGTLDYSFVWKTVTHPNFIYLSLCVCVCLSVNPAFFSYYESDFDKS